jgi:hypothetical protein
MEAPVVSIQHQSLTDFDNTMDTLIQLVTSSNRLGDDPRVDDMMRLLTAHFVVELLDLSSSLETAVLSKSMVQTCIGTMDSWPVMLLPVSQSICNENVTCCRACELDRQSFVRTSLCARTSHIEHASHTNCPIRFRSYLDNPEPEGE